MRIEAVLGIGRVLRSCLKKEALASLNSSPRAEQSRLPLQTLQFDILKYNKANSLFHVKKYSIFQTTLPVITS